jgi:hypothetical protein
MMAHVGRGALQFGVQAVIALLHQLELGGFDFGPARRAEVLFQQIDHLDPALLRLRVQVGGE